LKLCGDLALFEPPKVYLRSHRQFCARSITGVATRAMVILDTLIKFNR
jgi:hypothetical protein